MKRKEFEEHIKTKYGVTADHPWTKYRDNSVFRHRESKKWFALTMNIKRSLLGLDGEGTIDVVNLKCDFYLLCSLIEDDGFFPAYHMNKNNWITVLLDGSVGRERLCNLLEISYTLTTKSKKQ